MSTILTLNCSLLDLRKKIDFSLRICLMVIGLFLLNQSIWAVDLSAVSLSTSPATSALFGKPVILTATATGGVNVQYKFMSGAAVLRDFAAGNSYSLVPGFIKTYTFTVIAKDLGGIDPTATVTSPAVSVVIKPALSAVSLAVSPVSPSIVGKPVTFTATSTGGGTVLYKFMNGADIIRDFEASNSFVWTPLIAQTYNITVVAKDLQAADPNATVTSVNKVYIVLPTLSAVNLATTPANAVLLTKSVTLTATNTGGINVQYKFMTGALVLRDFSSSNSYTFTPAALKTYTFTVIAKDLGGLDPTATVTSPMVSVTTKTALTAVSLTTAPLNVVLLGRPVTLTATATGGANVQYKFMYGAVMLRDFASSNTLVWTPLALKTYTPLTVIAKDAGGIDPALTYTSAGVSVTTKTALLGVTLASVPATAVLLGNSVTLTATANGGVNLQYKFMYGAVILRDFASSNSIVWTPVVLKTYSNISVVVKDLGGADPTLTLTSNEISITTKTALTAVSLTTNPLNTATYGIPVTITATATGGVNVQYKFMYGAIILRDYNSSNSFNWTPVQVKTYSNVYVVAKDLGGADPNLTFSSPAINYVVLPPPPPTITSFSPTTGDAGINVQITGTCLLGTSSVKFNGKPAAAISNISEASLTATVAVGTTTGKITVTTPGGTGTSSTDFVIRPVGVSGTNQSDGAAMVWVPAGTFTMGTDYDPQSGAPNTQQVTLSGYWIYKYEVTVAQYRAFCAANARSMPPFPSGYSWAGKTGWDDPTLQQHPIVNVVWNDCKAYADWAGVSLPTEAQWEYSARGPSGLNYPWGGNATLANPTDGWDSNKCANMNNSIIAGTSTREVGSYLASASWCGVYDLAGNAWEWCADWAGNYAAVPVTNPTGAASGIFRVIRGGSWYDGDSHYTRGAVRYQFNPYSYGTGDNLGFRCVSTQAWVTNLAPEITSFSPFRGAPGTNVLITGVNLAGATSVRFNGVQALTITNNTPMSLNVVVPVGATTGKITVTTQSGTATSSTDFTVEVINIPGTAGTNPTDGAAMVWVPGGSFTMGTTYDSWWDGPKTQQVTLSGYWVYKYEVTVAQYRAFCTATSRELPHFPQPSVDFGIGMATDLSWTGKTGWDDPTVQQFPIVNVSWFDCKAYADWAGVSLPTEAQWEYASTGPAGNNFPWGGTATAWNSNNGWDQTKCANYFNSEFLGKSTWPVGSFPGGASWCGAQDLAGNVIEWCADWYGNYSLAPVTNPTGAVIDVDRILRGGSWEYQWPFYFRGSARMRTTPDTTNTQFGFRCATSASGISNLTPQITFFTPSSGGAQVLITGINLAGATEVRFNGALAQAITDNSSMSLMAVVPKDATTGKISVTTQSGTAYSPEDYVVALPGPTGAPGTNNNDGAALVWVPAGMTTMGTDYDSWWNQPKTQRVSLSGFWIYKYEVTVAQYNMFCTATSRAMPAFPTDYSWAGKSGWDDPALQQHPIVNVSWIDCKAYADWAGVSLPTEAQWEYACRGPVANNYPWGGVATSNNPYGGWDAKKCANASNPINAGKSTWPVGSFPAGTSWCGADDMAGNVWEWCNDWYGDYSQMSQLNPIGPLQGVQHIIRGGAWYGNSCNSFGRGAFRNGILPTGFNDLTGFRCIKVNSVP